MMSITKPTAAWQYNNAQLKLPDPRIEIARHMGWTLPISRNGTTWFGVEPDNYNFAIFDTRPHDLKFMMHQCFYKWDIVYLRQKIKGWVSVYIAEERLQSILFNREMLKIQPQATWRYANAKLIREKKPLLDREPGYSNRAEDNFSTEERLYQMGYYEKLQNKYFNGDEKFIKVLGTPRGSVLDYRPEVDNYEVEDY
jgi:hypothetical protein